MLRFGGHLLWFHLSSDWSRNNKHSRNFLWYSQFNGKYCIRAFQFPAAEITKFEISVEKKIRLSFLFFNVIGFFIFLSHYLGDFPIPEPSEPEVTTTEGKFGIDIALDWIYISNNRDN